MIQRYRGKYKSKAILTMHHWSNVRYSLSRGVKLNRVILILRILNKKETLSRRESQGCT